MELTKNIRWRRFQQMGHVMRMEGRVAKKALKGYIEGRRQVGRPRGKCLDDVDRDAKRMLECRNWRKSAEDRDAWRQRIEEAKDQV
jgi:hypothetical protein